MGDVREGACAGTTDGKDPVTADAGRVEVLGIESLMLQGTAIPVVHVRSTDTFSDAQTGSEVDEWWLDASTGLPLKIVVDASLKGGPSDYAEQATLELTTLDAAR